jgi:hypothetical protein
MAMVQESSAPFPTVVHFVDAQTREPFDGGARRKEATSSASSSLAAAAKSRGSNLNKQKKQPGRYFFPHLTKFQLLHHHKNGIVFDSSRNFLIVHHSVIAAYSEYTSNYIDKKRRTFLSVSKT